MPTVSRSGLGWTAEVFLGVQRCLPGETVWLVVDLPRPPSQSICPQHHRGLLAFSLGWSFCSLTAFPVGPSSLVAQGALRALGSYDV